MKQLKINHLAVWILVFTYQVISTLWYSPLLLANKWMNALGKKFEDFNGENVLGIVCSLCAATFLCYSIAWIFKKLSVQNGRDGFLISFFLWIAFFFFPTLTQDTFSMRQIQLTFINTGIQLINICLIGFVLGNWKKYTK